jgi:group I intron endonuclease
MICVYKITSPPGKVYVGSTIDFLQRIKHYRVYDCKPQVKLYNSLKKYGFAAHVIEIIECCTLDNLLERERFHGESLNAVSKNGLNLSLPGYGDVKALISQETINKMRQSQTKEKNNFFGRKHTPESIERLKKSLANKTPETIKRMSLAQIGKRATQEAKEKMSFSQKGRKHTSQTRVKMRDNNNNVKYVLCTLTGIFFTGTNEAAEASGINRHTLKNKLNGNKKNNTRFVYA